MKTHTMHIEDSLLSAKRRLPATSRGRALHTLDWFLNGRHTRSNYDNPVTQVTHLAMNK